MNDVQLAKDLLLGNKSVQLKRIAHSTILKLFMRKKSNWRKDEKYLMNLGKYLIYHIKFHSPTLKIYKLDAPGEDHNFLVLSIDCFDGSDANSVHNRFNEYEEVVL